MARIVDRLKDLQVRRLTKPGYYADGAGLYLSVKQSGAKSWIFRFRYGGKEHEMGLGGVDAFSLADARARAKLQRQMLADGKDPLAFKRAATAERKLAVANVITFDKAAQIYIASHRAGWKSAKHGEQWENTLETYASAVIGALPVSSVSTALMMRILEPIWTTKTETATRVRGRIEKILDWAKTQGYRTGDNPAAWRGHLENLLPPPRKTAKVAHHAALPWRQIGAFMKALRAMPGTAALALELIILTNCRTSEAIQAKWTEFDLKQKLWTIPAMRMKAGREHVIPLSDKALAVLERMKETASTGYVFPGKRDKPLSNMAALALLKRMGRADLTVHGFRSTFRDWAGEATAYPREVIEHAMAHQLKDKAEAAYQRGTLLERRRALMSDWSAYCDRPALPADVHEIRAKDAA